MTDEIDVIVCMGSACFARGNQQNLEFIEKYIKENDLNAKVIIGGSRCEGRCADGPNVFINGTEYNKVNEQLLKELLDNLSN